MTPPTEYLRGSSGAILVPSPLTPEQERRQAELQTARSREQAARVLAVALEAELRAAADKAPETVAAKAEIGRLSEALTTARRDHLAATGNLDHLAAAVDAATVSGKGQDAAEKSLDAGQVLVKKLDRRVSVLTTALAAAKVAFEEARDAAYIAESRRRRPALVTAATEAEAHLAALRERHAAELAKALASVATANALRGRAGDYSRYQYPTQPHVQAMTPRLYQRSLDFERESDAE